MIARLQIASWLVNFGAALWILGAVAWGLLRGDEAIETPFTAVWVFIASALARLILWGVSKTMVRP